VRLTPRLFSLRAPCQWLARGSAQTTAAVTVSATRIQGSKRCICFNGFEGLDCSLKACPLGTAWADVATAVPLKAKVKVKAIVLLRAINPFQPKRHGREASAEIFALVAAFVNVDAATTPRTVANSC